MSEKVGETKYVRLPIDIEAHILKQASLSFRTQNEQLSYYTQIGIKVEQVLGKEAAEKLLKIA